VFLLTITAIEFFQRLGFRTVARDEIDPAVHASGEFVAASCQSAVAMRQDLEARPVATSHGLGLHRTASGCAPGSE
jgi:hypothetical protein